MRLFLIGGLAVAVAAGVATFQIWRQGGSDEQRAADAIVVLGAAQYDGRPSPVFEARLEHAVALWHQGLARAFVVTGGKLPGDRTTEAAVAREYAIANGVPAEAIFGEDQAHNTLTSLSAVAGELRARDMESAVFVSDPTHMLRVLRIADDLGIDALRVAHAHVAHPGGPRAPGPGDRPRARCAGRLLRLGRGSAGGTAGRLTPSRCRGLEVPREPGSRPGWSLHGAADRERSRCRTRIDPENGAQCVKFLAFPPPPPLECVEPAPILGHSLSTQGTGVVAPSCPSSLGAPSRTVTTFDSERRGERDCEAG